MPIGRSVLTGKPDTAAGRRDKSVTIQQKPAPDAAPAGFPVPNWSDLRTVFMARRELRADERFATRQQSAFVETQWVSEYMADMDPELIDVPATRRFSYAGRFYDIVSASLMDRKTGIEYLTLGASGV